MERTRRIPLDIAPVEGESFEGWLLRASYITATVPADLLQHLHLSVTPATVLNGLFRTVSPDDAPALAAATGTPVDAWSDMFSAPQRYADRVSSIAGVTRFVAFRKRSSRYCPACLADSNGVWPWAWRLGWYLACPIHSTMMASSCPACRGNPAPYNVAPNVMPTAPHTCQRPHSDEGLRGPATPRCAHPLTNTAVKEASEPLVALARALLSLTELRMTPAVPEARTILHRFAGFAYAVVRTGPSPEAGDNDRNMTHRLAVAAAAALGDPDAFATLAAPPSPGYCLPKPSHWTHVPTDQLEAAVALRRPNLRTYDRLRWNGYSTTITTPTVTEQTLPPLIRNLPSALWADWAWRLIPTDLELGDRLARIHAVTLLTIPGWTATTSNLMDAWERPEADAGTVTRMLRLLAAHPSGQQTLQGLTHLANYVRRNGSPIDYQRRRTLLAEPVAIPTRDWNGWCTAAGIPPGTGRKRRLAGLWLTRRITGELTLVEGNPTADYDLYKFALALPLTVEQAMLAHARLLLDSGGCEGEPLTWSPPPAAVPTETWGKPDPPHVDPGTVEDSRLDYRQMRLLIDLGLFREPLQSHPRGPKHITEPDLRKAIIEDGLSAREAARLFGVSRATTQQRCRVYNIPLADRTYPRHNIDPDILRSLYVDQRLTLHEVAEQVGMSPSNVSRILQANRVPLRGRGGASHRVARTPTDVPPLLAAALKGQYGRQRVQRFQHVAASRSLNQAAQRLGVSQATLTDQVQQLEQAVGGPLLNRNERTNHPHTLTALGQELLHEADENLGAPDVPMQPGGILGDCLSLFRGEERLQRFVTIATSSSILEAATRLDSDPSTVVRSVRALEKALGVNLIEHHARSQPVRLTADGTELLRSAKRHTIR